MEYIDIPSVRKNASRREASTWIKNLPFTQRAGEKSFIPLLIDSNMENDKRARMLAMLESRKESFDEAIKDAKKKDISPDESENAPQPLSLDVRVEKNLMLSWGGPSDGFKFYYNAEGDELDAVYWFADWGTYEDQKDMIIVVSYSFTNEAQEKELEDKSFNEAAEKGLFKP